ncbi:hypothetical protein RHSIM_Rhsim04G0186900 [Rhododendron simsii]|uniref:Non-haem dioxygenase N-terminal domain-containing protein n=1 Tax=Rhododendron simsii TaxID=118357 RepID=A0A834LN77_RHOSS|nr:hypothetical protein RHSIM_Rhsim04G0186900 [Rhododendron simsii]
MVVTSNGEEIQEQIKPEYDRKSELKAFDDTKTGVKGLVDAGVTKIPRIFIHDKSKLNDISTTSSAASLFSVPVIDFEGVDQGSAQRAGIIKKVRDACEKLGFFQIVNHGIAKYLMDDMIDGVRRFHEQDTEVKKGFYSRDVTRKFIYNSNFDLYTGPATNWRDTFACFMAPQPPDPQELPAVCSRLMRFLCSIFECAEDCRIGQNLRRNGIKCVRYLIHTGRYDTDSFIPLGGASQIMRRRRTDWQLRKIAD